MNTTEKSAGNAPEMRFSTGAISATVWRNNGMAKDGQETEFNTVSLQRAYTDKSGKWQHTATLRVNDLPKAALVLNKAFEYLVLRGQNDIL